MDCDCNSCVGACRRQPGAFAPGEAEKAAELLGIPFETFITTHVIQEWYTESDGTELDYYRPRKLRDIDYPEALVIKFPRIFKSLLERPLDQGKRATFSDGMTTGICIFLKEGRCQIHAAKPMECRKAMPCQDVGAKEEVLQLWRSHLTHCDISSPML